MTAWGRWVVPVVLAALCAPAMAQECGGDFADWRQGVAAQASAQGVGQRGLDALSRAAIDPKVLAADRAQRVFAQSFSEFASRMISDYRLKQGAANMKKFSEVFARAERDYGVPAAVITAFWALETDFGACRGTSRPSTRSSPSPMTAAVRSCSGRSSSRS